MRFCLSTDGFVNKESLPFLEMQGKGGSMPDNSTIGTPGCSSYRVAGLNSLRPCHSVVSQALYLGPVIDVRKKRL